MALTLLDPWPWIQSFLSLLSNLSNKLLVKKRVLNYYALTTPVSSPTFPVIFDTGASSAISPHRSDFISYSPCSNRVINGLAKGLHIAGEGEVIWEHNQVIFKAKCYRN